MKYRMNNCYEIMYRKYMHEHVYKALLINNNTTIQTQ